MNSYGESEWDFVAYLNKSLWKALFYLNRQLTLL